MALTKSQIQKRISEYSHYVRNYEHGLKIGEYLSEHDLSQVFSYLKESTGLRDVLVRLKGAFVWSSRMADAYEETFVLNYEFSDLTEVSSSCDLKNDDCIIFLGYGETEAIASLRKFYAVHLPGIFTQSGQIKKGFGIEAVCDAFEEGVDIIPGWYNQKPGVKNVRFYAKENEPDSIGLKQTTPKTSKSSYKSATEIIQNKEEKEIQMSNVPADNSIILCTAKSLADDIATGAKAGVAFATLRRFISGSAEKASFPIDGATLDAVTAVFAASLKIVGEQMDRPTVAEAGRQALIGASTSGAVDLFKLLDGFASDMMNPK